MNIVKEIPVDNIVIPHDGIGIVIMQPSQEIVSPEPFVWADNKKGEQINKIIKTLEIAKSNVHTCEKTHFTLFPEYAIPGLDGVLIVEDIINDDTWQPGTFVIGGVDGLSSNEYSTLCSSSEYDDSANPGNVKDGWWVNTLIVWAKWNNAEGIPVVNKWVQPKLRPCWIESDTQSKYMYEGKYINIFKAKWVDGNPFRFFSIICYDWIAEFGAKSGISHIMNEVNSVCDPNNDPKRIHFLFVPQHNPKPSDRRILEKAYNYFNGDNSFPRVNTEKSVVVFINSAGGNLPGLHTKYGHTSFIFSYSVPFIMEGSPPSYAVETDDLRGTDALLPCTEALFRENGECVHALRLFHPNSIYGETHAPKPISPALVYSLSDTISDPRTPGSQVSAILKWVNDRIDIIPEFDANLGCLQASCNGHFNRIKDSLRIANDEYLNRMISSGSNCQDATKSIDRWTDYQQQSLKIIMIALSYISNVNPVKLADSLAQGWMDIDGLVIDIIVVSGSTHHENMKHASKYLSGREQRKLLIISRDDNETNSIVGRENSISNPDDNTIRCAFQDISQCLQCSSVEEFKRKITEVILR